MCLFRTTLPYNARLWQKTNMTKGKNGGGLNRLKSGLKRMCVFEREGEQKRLIFSTKCVGAVHGGENNDKITENSRV